MYYMIAMTWDDTRGRLEEHQSWRKSFQLLTHQGWLGVLQGAGSFLGGGLLLQHALQGVSVQEAVQLQAAG